MAAVSKKKTPFLKWVKLSPADNCAVSSLVVKITSLHRDFLPSSWGMFEMTFFDWSILLGSFGLFFTLFLLFVRFLPVVAMSEVKGVMDPEVAKSAPAGPAASVQEG